MAFGAIAGSLVLISPFATGAELKQGRYIGSLKLDEQGERVAVVADFFLEQPKSYKEFVRLKSVFKLSLGGYNTHEYFVEKFDDIKDSGLGTLTFDEPENDLVITAEVKEVSSKTVFKGQVYIRSSAASGFMDLTLEDDEPPEGDDSENSSRLPSSRVDEAPFIPLLEGQYEGLCEGNKQAMFQLQTVRGLKTIWQGETETSSLGRYYGIVGRVAYKDSIQCGDLGPNQWCTLYNFGGGSYNFYLGKLNLHGARSSEECDITKGEMKCRIRMQGLSIDCNFKKKDTSVKPAKFFARQYNLRPTAEQMQDLPPPAPPENKELNLALRGNFAGYLHNETNDTYQIVRINVVSFSTDLNPMHNPTGSQITTNAAVHLNRTVKDPFFTQRYEPRSSYWVPGFTLNDSKTDSYINVAEWKRGYIRGTWYSHAFGKVGTVQLVKGSLPPIPEAAAMVPSFAGEFEGPMAPDGSVAKLRWFKFLFPTQPTDLIGQLIKYTGSYQPLVGITAVHDIERGTFDPYTGVFGWIISKGEAATFASGYIGSDNNARMYWPPAPDVFGARTGNYVIDNYKRR